MRIRVKRPDPYKTIGNSNTVIQTGLATRVATPDLGILVESGSVFLKMVRIAKHQFNLRHEINMNFTWSDPGCFRGSDPDTLPLDPQLCLQHYQFH